MGLGVVMVTSLIQKIVSGSQTGVDRAGLDVALEFEIQCGGWCPKGRRAYAVDLIESPCRDLALIRQ